VLSLHKEDKRAMRRTVLEGQLYTHTKTGNLYLVLHSEAKETEEGKPVVVYKALYGDCDIWVRPLEEFLGLNKDGKPRFTSVHLKRRHESLKADFSIPPQMQDCSHLPEHCCLQCEHIFQNCLNACTKSSKEDCIKNFFADNPYISISEAIDNGFKLGCRFCASFQKQEG
jgi:hypothetical protein